MVYRLCLSAPAPLAGDPGLRENDLDAQQGRVPAQPIGIGMAPIAGTVSNYRLAAGIVEPPDQLDGRLDAFALHNPCRPQDQAIIGTCADDLAEVTAVFIRCRRRVVKVHQIGITRHGRPVRRLNSLAARELMTTCCISSRGAGKAACR
jgi:hypothetical protein